MKKVINSGHIIFNMKYALFLVVLLLALSYSFSYIPIRTTIWSDDFENPAYSNSVWNLDSDWTITIVDGIDNSMYSLFAENTNNFEDASVVIDLHGYKNIEVSFLQYKHNGGGWGSSEELRVYANSTLLMDETSPTDILGHRHYALDSSFDNSVLNLIFSADSSGGSYTVVDNVVVTGEIISYQPNIISYGYSNNVPTNSYACIWVKATRNGVDNVTYAYANVTAPNGKTFLVKLTDTGYCSEIGNAKDDDIYAGSFYVGSEDGLYKVNSITVYTLTDNSSTQTINGNINVYKPNVWYNVTLLDTYNSNYHRFYANLTICSSYSYDKHFDEYYVVVPDNVAFYWYYNGTDWLSIYPIYNDKYGKMIKIENITVPANSCVTYKLLYDIDPVKEYYNDYYSYYYQQLCDSAYDMYLHCINGTSYENIGFNLFIHICTASSNFNKTVHDILDHPSHVSRYNYDQLMQMADRMDDQYQDIFLMCQSVKNEQYKNDIINYINQSVVQNLGAKIDHINDTVTKINQTVNKINETTNLTYNDTQQILSYVISIKSDTVDIKSMIVNLNQSEQQRYLDIINRIDSDANDILSMLHDINDKLGYNSSSTTLKEDISDIQAKILDIQNAQTQLYDLTQQINQTVNAINSKMDIVMDKVDNMTDTVISMNQTVSNMDARITDINYTTHQIYNDTQNLLLYVQQIKSQNNQIIDLINDLNDTEKQRYLSIISEIDSKANHIEQLINALQLSLGYNASTETLRYDIQQIQSDIGDIYSLEQQLHTLTLSINSTVTDIQANVTSSISMLKSMFNCTYNSSSSICTRLDNIENLINNLNQSNVNQTMQLKSEINKMYLDLGCESNASIKACTLLKNINSKIPNERPANVTLPLTGSMVNQVRSYGEMFSQLNKAFQNLVGSIVNLIWTYTQSLFNTIRGYI